MYNYYNTLQSIHVLCNIAHVYVYVLCACSGCHTEFIWGRGNTAGGLGGTAPQMPKDTVVYIQLSPAQLSL